MAATQKQGIAPMIPNSEVSMDFVSEFLPNTRKVEIELTTKCNLLCRSCDRRCTQAPASEEMPLNQIEDFIRESRELSYQWEGIVLLGGEPTFHPQFREIVSLLVDYARHGHGCKMSVVSNAHGTAVRNALMKVRGIIEVVERPKNRRSDWFNNVDIAPIDIPAPLRSCKNTSECGLGLTTRGYFPCGAGAAIARVLNMDVGIHSLYDVNIESLACILPILCRYCGHPLAVRLDEDDGVSPFWQEAYSRYHMQEQRKKR